MNLASSWVSETLAELDVGTSGNGLAYLLMTLEQAPDRIDDLFIQCTRRFVEMHGAEASNEPDALARSSGAVRSS